MPEVTLQNLSSTEPIEGDPIALTCSISGGWPQIGQIQWLKDSVRVNPLDPRFSISSSPISIDPYELYGQYSILSINASIPEDSGVYTCKSNLRVPGFPMVSDDISIMVQSMPYTNFQFFMYNYLYFFLYSSK